MESYYSLGQFILLALVISIVLFVVIYFLFKSIFKKWITGKEVLIILSGLTVLILEVATYAYINLGIITANQQKKAFLYEKGKVITLVDYDVVTNLSSLRFTYGPKILNYAINIPEEFGKYITHSYAGMEVVYDYDDEKLLAKECQRLIISNLNKEGDYSLDTLFARAISSIKNWQPYEDPKIVSVEYYYKQYLNSYLSGTGIQIKGVNLLYLDPPIARGPNVSTPPLPLQPN
ncbi:MAG: hypothetical protein ACOZAJ_00350 [Patescibacteria group bacterium]